MRSADSSWLVFPHCSGPHLIRLVSLLSSVDCPVRHLSPTAFFEFLCPTHSLAFPSYFQSYRDLESKPFVWFRAKTDKGIVCLADHLHSVTPIRCYHSGWEWAWEQWHEEVLHIPQSSSIFGASPSDCLASYPGHSLERSYPSAEIQPMYFIAPANLARVYREIKLPLLEFTKHQTSSAPCMGGII